jgi:hypothetical protein
VRRKKDNDDDADDGACAVGDTASEGKAKGCATAEGDADGIRKAT